MPQERLQKLLSQWGLASRRQAERLIADGQVRVNGAIATLGQKANPEEDLIEVQGKFLKSEHRPRQQYLLINKPLGVISTCDDPQGRTTVLDLLPPELQQIGLHPVGRLDADSTGALLLTNDGALTHWLTHPSHDVAKTYRVRVSGQPLSSTLNRWRQGVRLDGRMTRPAEIKLLHQTSDSTELEILLREGRNRQIRRVANQLGHPVLRLHRVAIGSLKLGRLGCGSYRHLSSRDLETLLKAHTHDSLPLSSSVACCG